MSILLHDLDKLETGVYFLSVDKNDEDVPMYILGQNNGFRSIFVAFGRVDSVPPHGDLIDRNEFVKDECNHCDGACEKMPCNCLNCREDCRCDMILALLDAPVILPAEEETT